jgi:hypothetical protein
VILSLADHQFALIHHLVRADMQPAPSLATGKMTTASPHSPCTTGN